MVIPKSKSRGMASASAEKAKNECLDATYAGNRSDPSFHKRKLYQEERKIKQEWVTSLLDAMVMAEKMQNDATFPRMEQIRPCLVAAAKEMFQTDPSDRMAIWR